MANFWRRGREVAYARLPGVLRQRRLRRCCRLLPSSPQERGAGSAGWPPAVPPPTARNLLRYLRADVARGGRHPVLKAVKCSGNS